MRASNAPCRGAEGVETAEQLEVVMGFGFDAGQGYLLKRPAPAMDAVTLDLPSLAHRAPAMAPATA